jgi:hypothetical protein
MVRVKRHVGEGNGEVYRAPIEAKTAANDPRIFLKFIDEDLALSESFGFLEERRRPTVSRLRDCR